MRSSSSFSSSSHLRGCPAISAWRYQTFWQIVETVDFAMTHGESHQAVEGKPLLTGKQR